VIDEVHAQSFVELAAETIITAITAGED